MNRWLLAFICLLPGSFSVQAQTIYESFEVDKVGEPQGGQSMLQLFIQSNLNVPVKAQADRIKGRVFVSGVVEPDGKISSLSVTRGLRPDCNREALRVLNLFNAWVPARKDGQPVRQQIIYPVTFTPGSPVYVREGNLIEYFTKAGDAVADTAAAIYYRQNTPVDTLTNLPTGDRVVYQRNGAKWRELTRFRFMRAPVDMPANDPAQQRTQLVFLDAQGRLSQTFYTFYPNGSIALQLAYENGTVTGERLEYTPNGLLTAIEQREQTALGIVETKGLPFTGKLAQQPVVASHIRRTTWHSNGQLERVEVRSVPLPGQPVQPTKLMSQWDSTGVVFVADGNGQATHTQLVTSRRDSTKQTRLVETGLVRDGLREGNWVGRYTDGSYRYDDVYESGRIRGGTSQETVAGVSLPPVEYDAVEQNPEPMGGMRVLSAYLGQALRYPEEAQRANVQGTVVVSFIVNTDGSISNVRVIKGVGFGCDQEAARVVRNMPRWKPGIQRGEPVRVKFNLPIEFKTY